MFKTTNVHYYRTPKKFPILKFNDTDKKKINISPHSRLRLAQRLKLMLKGQNVMLKDMVMEVMANTAKRLLKKLPTMYLYLPQLISLSRLVLFYLRKDMFNFYH